MSVCETARPAPLRCPTIAEILAGVLAILPKGRAWQSNEGGPLAGIARGFDPASFDNNSFSTRFRPGSTLLQFWQAIAEVFAFVNQRLCDLRLEFWCATQTETRDLWMAEYGLPDACDPFPDLCTKVAAIGGTRCDYYAAIAARAGWSIACRDNLLECGTRAGSRRAKAGRARPGRVTGGRLVIVVDLNTSPAFSGRRRIRTKAGRAKAGRMLSCGRDYNFKSLECLLGRIVHAENQITYEAING